MDCCVKGQGHRGSECQWLYVWMISSEQMNLSLPNLVCWHHQELECHVKRLVCCLQGQVTVKAGICLVWCYIIMSWGIMWKDWIAVVKIKVTAKVKIFSVCLAVIFWTAEPFVTKLGMVIHHHGPECPTKRLVASHGQDHNEGSYNQIWPFLPYLLNCWSFYNQI